jgi:hypothetical protein
VVVVVLWVSTVMTVDEDSGNILAGKEGRQRQRKEKVIRKL